MMAGRVRWLVLTLVLCGVVFSPLAAGASPVPDNPDQRNPSPVVHGAGDPLPPVTPGMLIVLGIVVVALVFFTLEPVPMDITALGIMVTLILLEPWTGISPTEGIAGFASTATITVLCMFILSEGVRKTGVIRSLGQKLVQFTSGSLSKQLSTVIGIVTPSSALLNNTAVVAILLPMVSNLATECKNSPSKLLIPLSYASMFGGMLTLIGTSTNLLASDLSARLLGHPFSMFEFTLLGVLVSVVGTLYLLTLGRWLLPDRIQPRKDLTERFELGDYLTEVAVKEGSPMIGRTVQSAFTEDLDVEILQLVRGEDVFIPPMHKKTLHPGDILIVRTNRSGLMELIEDEQLTLLHEITVTEQELESAESGENLVEVVIAPRSPLVGETLRSSNFRDRYDGTVLALRHGGQLVRERLDNIQLRVGDTLLVQAPVSAVERLNESRDFIVAQDLEEPGFRSARSPVALGIVGGVVGLASLGVTSILTAALLGALMMVLTGCLKPSEIYDAVHWDIVFLLAGLIPLGTALEACGAADLLAGLIVQSSVYLPALVVLGLLYIITALLTNIVSNNASVLLMIPVAVDTAMRLESNPFAFVIAVTFAASTAFMTPMGYQTNLFVYGPGGYKFRDFLTVGAPLQLLFALVTPVGIYMIWPL